MRESQAEVLLAVMTILFPSPSSAVHDERALLTAVIHEALDIVDRDAPPMCNQPNPEALPLQEILDSQERAEFMHDASANPRFFHQRHGCLSLARTEGLKNGRIPASACAIITAALC
ncbi:hypothetical protein FB567DRAFT_148485 [Paraphoma chrysanthemicola]|uniref:Uncharacterized protein n=1 Tax=Paraphoma chrysanthemicola TaxID=798071 RepID=A0A8K0VV73_9PLEO|nr:hypothetical protein FB567DRAFT_148485 [Paraphoma chrysanthemicola]